MVCLELIPEYWKKIKYATLVALMVLFWGHANADDYSEAEFKTLIKDYQVQINVLDSQIRDIRKDKDWLLFKIDRMSDSGQEVPGVLKASAAAKETKIIRLEKQKQKITTRVADYEKVYQAKFSDPKIPEPSLRPQINISDEASDRGNVSGIKTAIQKAGLEDWVDVMDGGGCAKLHNILPILFSSGSAVLATEYKLFLKKLAQFLKSYDVKVQVTGFADSDPIRTKRYPSNFELGAYRAANVIHEMVRSGLKPDIFKIGTTGAYRFAAEQPSSEKTFQRRAQVTVVFSS